MQHNPHLKLFQDLAAITDQVRVYIRAPKLDTDAIFRLTEAHSRIVRDIQAADITIDEEIIGIVRILKKQIADTIEEAEARKDDILTRIKLISDTQKLIRAFHAYGT